MSNKGASGAGILLRLAVLVVLVGAVYFYFNRKPAEVNDNSQNKKDKLVLQLKWVPQAQFAGYFVAEEMGYFDEENLEVEIKSGGVGINPLDVFISDGADVP